MKVFLGGTVSGSKWRDALIPKLKIDCFNPVLPVWTEEAYQQELVERATCDFLLYVITPLAKGFYSIAELVDDSNKRPEKTIYMILEEDAGVQFSRHQLLSLQKVGEMVRKNGALWLGSMEEVVEVLNVDFFLE
jgi:hypothetical protein